MSTLSVKITNSAQLQAMFRRAPGVVTSELNRAVPKAAHLVERGAKRRVPVRTGRLRSSIKTFTRPLMATIRPLVKYADFVHDGTRAHTIRPKKARALAFKKGGKMIFARGVRHPGTKAQPFMANAVDAGRGAINSIFLTATKNITKKLSI